MWRAMSATATSCRNVLEDRAGAVWISYVGGLARVEPATARLRRWTVDERRRCGAGRREQAGETGDGMIWLITEDGAMQVRAPDGRVRESLMPASDIGLAKGSFIEQAGLGPDGALWLAGSQGLSVWNAGMHRFEPVPGGRAWARVRLRER